MGKETYDSVSGLMLYSFNMPLFFFVSGFLAYLETMSAGQICKGLWRKFLFLVVPAVVFKIFMDLLWGYNPLHILQDGYGGYWFTITLFECFLLYYAVALVFRRSDTQMIIMVVLAIIGIGVLSLYGEFGPKLLDMNRLTKYFQFFLFGLIAMRYRDLFERTMSNEWIKAGAIMLFFLLLFSIGRMQLPSAVFHVLRDLLLRYLGTYIVVSFFVCKKTVFDEKTHFNRIILSIGRKSLAIYLLQYFFIPNFKAWPEWIAGLDELTVHVISLAYAMIITVLCLLFIEFLSNSRIVGKYALGQKQ